jgi:hypothetical protein
MSHMQISGYKADSIPLEVLKRMISIAYQLRPVAAPVGLTSHIEGGSEVIFR